MRQGPLPVSGRPKDSGFTLVELMSAIIVLVVGVLGLAKAMMGMTRYQDLSGSYADMTALGDHKIEQLRVAATYSTADTMQLVVGGSMTVPSAQHVDTLIERGRTYLRLWQVQAGPAGTRQISLRVRPLVDNARTPSQVDFTTLIQMMTNF
jgi:prepilin-type N-terminal cleavage/methylation domain-containing protein